MQSSTGSTENASASNAAGDCNPGSKDVWYSFVATAPEHTITVDGDADFDAVIGVLTSCDGTERPLGGNCVSTSGDDGVETLTLWELTVGATYYIQVYDAGNRNLASSTFSICVSAATPNASNPCNAIAITPVSGNTCTPVDNYSTGVTTDAGAVAPAPNCTPFYNYTANGWLTFTTATAQNIFVSGAPGSFSGDDAAIAVYSASGPCADLALIACQNPAQTSLLNQPAGTYYIRFWNHYGVSGDLNICVATEPALPANDDCNGAISITDGSTISMSTMNATSDLPTAAPDCGIAQMDHGVWFVYTAADNTNGTVTLSGCNTDFDSRVNVFTTSDNSCPSINNVATCVITTDNDDDCNGPGSDFAETTTFSYSNLNLRPNGSAESSAGKNYYVLVFGGAGNLDFTVAQLPLPLELASFTGQVQGSINVLYWETLTEKNVRFHIVERSMDGQHWREIGRENGLTNSATIVKYSLEDRAPLAKAYYRLRSVDFDGKESRSNAILLARQGEQFGITSVYPSPANSNVTVQFNATQEETVTVRILDLTGRLVLEQTTEAVPDINELPITLQGLQAGVYTVTVSNAAGVSAPVRLVKQ